MDSIQLLREQAKTAFEWLNGTAADLTTEQAHWRPDGKAHPAGERYAHALSSTDAIVNNMLKGGAPMFASTWQGKSGFSEPVMFTSQEIAHRVKIDMPALQEYAKAVEKDVNDYLATLKPEDLDRVIDLTSVELGHQNVGWVISNLIIGHLHDIMGEISAVKGVQGLKGYPF